MDLDVELALLPLTSQRFRSETPELWLAKKGEKEREGVLAGSSDFVDEDL